MSRKFKFVYSVFLLLDFTLPIVKAVRSKDSETRNPLLEGVEVNQARKEKLFSLFNVVHFNNGGCTSQMSNDGNGNRAGTCFTTSECASRSGRASGNCAAGFGVCCVFILDDGGAVTQNCTYLQNPDFPKGSNPAETVIYTITKCTNDVCSLRLDFLTFNTVSQTDSNEPAGGACQDSLTLKTSGLGASVLPIICGGNNGQHVYLDIGQDDGDTATVMFAFSTAIGVAGTLRTWDIKVTQALCGVNSLPDGCFQYFTAATGTIMTFNFENDQRTHLANQMYTICIRQCKGFCCIQYLPCANTPGAFSIDEMQISDVGTMTDTSAIDSQCTRDYIIISGASSQCSNSDTAQTSRICGTHFGATSGNIFNAGIPGGIPAPVCDCSQPFDVSIHTDALPENMPAPNPNVQSRGVCLTYMQLPCASTS